MLSVFHAVYDVTSTFEDHMFLEFSSAVRKELKCARDLLFSCYADLFWNIAPIVFAQDAEGRVTPRMVVGV